MNIFSGIPIPALILLVILVLIIPATIILLIRSRKAKIPKPQPQTPTPKQGAPLPTQVVSDQNQAQTLQQTITQPATSDETRFLILILAAAVLALLVPLLAILIVKYQPIAISQPQINQQISQNSACRAITITDTLNNPLSATALQQLRPGDEIKILISSSGDSLDKARFRVNGSQWQDVTIKEANNFIGNYILDIGIKKFTIEAEVHDKSKGWL